MSDKPYDNPDRVAKARYRGGEKHSYSDMADELGCSTGVISLRMGKFDIDENYNRQDFEDESPVPEVTEDDGLDLPFELELPENWPPSEETLAEYDIGDPQFLINEVKWNCQTCTDYLDEILQGEFGVSVDDVLVEG